MNSVYNGEIALAIGQTFREMSTIKKGIYDLSPFLVSLLMICLIYEQQRPICKERYGHLDILVTYYNPFKLRVRYLKSNNFKQKLCHD